MSRGRYVQRFNDNVAKLVQEIQANQGLSLGASCQLLNVTPWTIREYAKAIVQLRPEISFSRNVGFQLNQSKGGGESK